MKNLRSEAVSGHPSISLSVIAMASADSRCCRAYQQRLSIIIARHHERTASGGIWAGDINSACAATDKQRYPGRSSGQLCAYQAGLAWLASSHWPVGMWPCGLYVMAWHGREELSAWWRRKGKSKETVMGERRKKERKKKRKEKEEEERKKRRRKRRKKENVYLGETINNDE